MKIVLQLKNKPVSGDILVFDGEHFECVSKNSFLKEQKDKITDLESLVSDLIDRVTALEADVTILKGEDE